MKEQKYFGEWVTYDSSNETETEEAIRYLQLWKKFFLRKLQSEFCEFKLIDTYEIERPPFIVSCLAQHAQKGMKICVEANFKKTLETKCNEISCHDLSKDSYS
jgi:hypothetical protein